MPKITCLLTGLLLAFVVGCTAVNLPSVTDQPTNARLPGKIIWHDLITDTPAATEKFYSALFGWKFELIGLSSFLTGCDDPQVYGSVGVSSGYSSYGGLRSIQQWAAHARQHLGGWADPLIRVSAFVKMTIQA